MQADELRERIIKVRNELAVLEAECDFRSESDQAGHWAWARARMAAAKNLTDMTGRDLTGYFVAALPKEGVPY